MEDDDVFEPGTRMVPVFAASWVSAEMIRSLLEGSGVQAVARGGSSGAYPLTVGALGEAQVYVREADEERARAIIADVNPEKPAGATEPDPWTPRRVARVIIATLVLIPFAAGVIAMVMSLLRGP